MPRGPPAFRVAGRSVATGPVATASTKRSAAAASAVSGDTLPAAKRQRTAIRLPATPQRLPPTLPPPRATAAIVEDSDASLDSLQSSPLRASGDLVVVPSTPLRPRVDNALASSAPPRAPLAPAAASDESSIDVSLTPSPRPQQPPQPLSLRRALAAATDLGAAPRLESASDADEIEDDASSQQQPLFPLLGRGARAAVPVPHEDSLQDSIHEDSESIPLSPAVVADQSPDPQAPGSLASAKPWMASLSALKHPTQHRGSFDAAAASATRRFVKDGLAVSLGTLLARRRRNAAFASLDTLRASASSMSSGTTPTVPAVASRKSTGSPVGAKVMTVRVMSRSQEQACGFSSTVVDVCNPSAFLLVSPRLILLTPPRDTCPLLPTMLLGIAAQRLVLPGVSSLGCSVVIAAAEDVSVLEQSDTAEPGPAAAEPASPPAQAEPVPVLATPRALFRADDPSKSPDPAPSATVAVHESSAAAVSAEHCADAVTVQRVWVPGVPKKPAIDLSQSQTMSQPLSQQLGGPGGIRVAPSGALVSFPDSSVGVVCLPRAVARLLSASTGARVVLTQMHRLPDQPARRYAALLPGKICADGRVRVYAVPASTPVADAVRVLQPCSAAYIPPLRPRLAQLLDDTCGVASLQPRRRVDVTARIVLMAPQCRDSQVAYLADGSCSQHVVLRAVGPGAVAMLLQAHDAARAHCVVLISNALHQAGAPILTVDTLSCVAAVDAPSADLASASLAVPPLQHALRYPYALARVSAAVLEVTGALVVAACPDCDAELQERGGVAACPRCLGVPAAPSARYTCVLVFSACRVAVPHHVLHRQVLPELAGLQYQQALDLDAAAAVASLAGLSCDVIAAFPAAVSRDDATLLSALSLSLVSTTS